MIAAATSAVAHPLALPTVPAQVRGCAGSVPHSTSYSIGYVKGRRLQAAFRPAAALLRGLPYAWSPAFVGPGKIALLEAIEATGSITAAAKTLGMSYRRAWLLLDETNRSLKRPAVDSAKGGPHGGRSLLTDEGRKPIALYRHIEATARTACRSDIRRLMEMLAR